MATGSPPAAPETARQRLRVDFALVGLGVGLIALGSLQGLPYGLAFGDGVTVGAGATLLGAGMRGLLAAS